jgi:hypothetical protein
MLKKTCPVPRILPLETVTAWPYKGRAAFDACRPGDLVDLVAGPLPPVATERDIVPFARGAIVKREFVRLAEVLIRCKETAIIAHSNPSNYALDELLLAALGGADVDMWARYSLIHFVVINEEVGK